MRTLPRKTKKAYKKWLFSKHLTGAEIKRLQNLFPWSDWKNSIYNAKNHFRYSYSAAAIAMTYNYRRFLFIEMVQRPEKESFMKAIVHGFLEECKGFAPEIVGLFNQEFTYARPQPRIATE